MTSTAVPPASPRPDTRHHRPRAAGINVLSAIAIFAGLALVASFGVVVGSTSPAGALATFGPISDISLSNSTISETSTAYQLSATDVPGTTTSTDLTATFTTGTAAWSSEAPSGAVTSGSLSSGTAATITLERGVNTIDVVHSNGGVDTTYSIRLFREGVFSDLTFTTPGVTMTPAWDPDVHDYTLSDVPHQTNTLNFDVVTTQNEAGFLQCGLCDWWLFEARTDMTARLEPGSNVLEFVYQTGGTAYSGTPGTIERYRVTVERDTLFGADRLTDLSLSNTAVTPTAAPYTLKADDVPGTTDSTDLTATFPTGTATWSSGSASGSLSSGVAATVPVAEGANTITVTHTDGGVDTTYTVSLFRRGTFSDLTFTTPGVTMTPAWDPDVHDYTLSDVPHEINRLAFDVTISQNAAGFLQCGICDWWLYNDRTNMTAALQTGSNVMEFVYQSGGEAYSGTPGTIERYRVTVERAGAFGTDRLTGLSLSNSTLSDTSTPYTLQGTDVPRSTDSTDVTATFDTGSATWSSTGPSGATGSGTITSGAPATVSLEQGWNDITVTHSNDGVDTTYVARVFRTGTFEQLAFTGLPMTPEWDPEVFNYSLGEVDYSVDRITFTVDMTQNEPGFLQCTQCDWWLYEGRGVITATLAIGSNCLDFRYQPGSTGYSGANIEHYYVSVDRGTVTSPEPCVSPSSTTTTTEAPTTTTTSTTVPPTTTAPTTTAPTTTVPTTTAPTTTVPAPTTTAPSGNAPSTVPPTTAPGPDATVPDPLSDTLTNEPTTTVDPSQVASADAGRTPRGTAADTRPASLAFTGGPTAAPLTIGLALLVLGLVGLAIGRRRRGTA